MCHGIEFFECQKAKKLAKKISNIHYVMKFLEGYILFIFYVYTCINENEVLMCNDAFSYVLTSSNPF